MQADLLRIMGICGIVYLKMNFCLWSIDVWRKNCMKKGKALLDEIRQCTDSAFWWLGQLGFALKLENRLLYIDAYLAESPERIIPPLLQPEELADADFILGSHNHSDHIDWNVWRKIASSSPKPRFILPKALIDEMGEEIGIARERLIGLDDGASYETDGLKITGVAAAHEFLDPVPATGCFPYLGYVIESSRFAVYHSGDTCIYEGLIAKLKKWEKLNVLFLPINGRDGSRYRSGCIGNMTYQEAADLAGTLKPDLAVPAHYEMFRSNSENPYLFADYLEAKYPEVKFWIGPHGEKVAIQD